MQKKFKDHSKLCISEEIKNNGFPPKILNKAAGTKTMIKSHII